MAEVMPGTTSNGTPAVAERRRLLAAPGEHERVTALEPDDRLVPRRQVDQQRVDLVLGHRDLPRGLADADALGAGGRQVEERLHREPVVDDDVGPSQHLVGPHGEQTRVTRARPPPGRRSLQQRVRGQLGVAEVLEQLLDHVEDERRVRVVHVEERPAPGVGRVAHRPRAPGGRPRPGGRSRRPCPAAPRGWPCARTPPRARRWLSRPSPTWPSQNSETPQQWTMSAATALVVGPSGRSFTRSSPSRSATASSSSNARRT